VAHVPPGGRDTSKGLRILYAIQIPAGGGFQHPLPRMARRTVIGSVECMARISRVSPRTRKPTAQSVTIIRLGIDALTPSRRDALRRAAGDVSRIEVLSPTSFIVR
jgi:hypothetical protein